MTQHITLWKDRPAHPKEFVDISILLAGAQCIIWLCWCLSLIEYLKVLLMSVAPVGRRRHARSFAIDIYMLAKWVLLGFLVWFEASSAAAIYIASYMIAGTFFSYFYYHVWRTPSHNDSHRRQLRRSVAFLLSFLFGLFAYAYIYRFGYTEAITWPQAQATFTDALLMSMANAFTASFAAAEPVGQTVRYVMAGQMMFVFGFLVIVVVNSVPSRR